MPVLLSICIPTYNREKYLKHLLDNILQQLNNIEDCKVEICISDNASVDNTKELIQRYQIKYKNITYFRWDENRGADNNYFKTVEIANGEYCWFLGSDDLIDDLSIGKILNELKEGNDIYLIDRIICDINMNEIKRTKIFKENVSAKIFHFGTDKKIEHYLNAINEFTGIFSYLSSIIVKKSQWDSIYLNKDFIGTAYAHSFILLSMLKKNITLKYINDYLVLNRGANDSFSSEGVVGRIKLDFDGFELLFSKVFDKNIGFKKYYIKLLKNHYRYREVMIILINSSPKDRNIFIESSKAVYNSFLLRVAMVSILCLRFLYRKTFKNIISHNKA